jgi:thiamine biosynthesis protein ThiI
VNLDNPDLKINIKIKQNNSFIFLEKKQAVGGLPIGSGGEAIALFSGGIDSPVAAFLAMKRGLKITAVHFHSVPQTSEESIEKVKDLIKELSKFQKKIKLYLIPIIPVQKNIVKNCDRKLSIVLQRRMFFKIAKKISEIEKEKFGKNIQAFITGDSLGQVASQTLENMATVSEVLDGKNKIIFRPLLTYDKREIMDLARKIGTLEISEKPHEDACSLFVPEKPETKANLEYTKKEEEKIDLKILDEIIEKKEIFEI